MESPRKCAPTCAPLLGAGIVLGIGLGGFMDGILFHQILQTHNMISGRLPAETLVNVETAMVWDGLFHAFTWLTTAIGVGLLWKAGAREGVSWSGRLLLGSMIAGWGLFNLLEGVVDHHLLHVHHVVERLGVSVYDYAFLASGVLFIAIGGLLARSATARERPTAMTPPMMA